MELVVRLVVRLVVKLGGCDARMNVTTKCMGVSLYNL
jgi:hypothetical protein